MIRLSADGTLFLRDDDAAAAILTELQNAFALLLLQDTLHKTKDVSHKSAQQVMPVTFAAVRGHNLFTTPAVRLPNCW